MELERDHLERITQRSIGVLREIIIREDPDTLELDDEGFPKGSKMPGTAPVYITLAEVKDLLKDVTSLGLAVAMSINQIADFRTTIKTLCKEIDLANDTISSDEEAS